MTDTTLGSEKKYREVLVAPRAARREALYLAAAVGLIVLLMGVRFYLLSSGKEALQEKPACQLSDIYLQNQAPVLYRSLLGVVGDIIDLHQENGTWPDVEQLKEEALPPFAGNFLPVGLRGYVWKSYPHAGWVDYFGVNSEVGAGSENQAADPLENSFILRIIDLNSTEHPHPHAGNHGTPGQRYVGQVWINPRVTDYPGQELIKRDWKWVVGADQAGQ